MGENKTANGERMMKVIGYVRVSTQEQADGGVSLAAQESKVRAYASLHDLDLVEVIIDAGESAKTIKRPGLQNALAMLKRGEASGMIVAKLDRLSRSVGDWNDLIDGYFGEKVSHVGGRFDRHPDRRRTLGSECSHVRCPMGA